VSKHTPGDWYVETDERYGPDHAYIRTGEGRDGVLICTMNRTVRHRLTPPNDIAADAALIAAAPDLLVALEDTLEWLQTGKVDGVGFDEKSIVDSLQEAINKAGGAK